MKSQTLTLTFLVACALVAAPLAMAQTNRGMQNEFGTISAPYSVDIDGQRAPIEVTVVIENAYHEKDGRFYMFIFDARQTHLSISLDYVIRTDTGQEMDCFKREGDDKEQKCSIDGRKMPPQGTPLKMVGTVGGARTGAATLGAMVMPFTATWEKIYMSNGFEAQLYAGSDVHVLSPTDGGSGTGLVGKGNKLPVPGIGALGVAAAALVALGIAAQRRR